MENETLTNDKNEQARLWAENDARLGGGARDLLENAWRDLHLRHDQAAPEWKSALKSSMVKLLAIRDDPMALAALQTALNP